METNILEPEYTVDEVADMLHIHPSAVRRRIKRTQEPKLEARREGKAYRIPRSKFLAYYDSTHQWSA